MGRRDRQREKQTERDRARDREEKVVKFDVTFYDTTQGLKRTEQHALIDLFKAKVATSSAGNKSSPAAATASTSLTGIIGGERGLLGMRKLEMGLEKFMTRTRTATEFKSSK